MKDARSQCYSTIKKPVVKPDCLGQEKDGTLRFCVHYRRLNSVTKADTFPLPRMDDILDQLGDCKFFSTLDLKSGYWQIRVHPDSQEKTEEQKKDEKILSMIRFQQEKILPEDTANTRRIAAQSPMFTVIEEILYYLDDKQPGVKQIVVPKHLRVQIMQDYHSSIILWQVIFLECDCTRPYQGDGGGMECTVMLWSIVRTAIVSGMGRKSNPPLKPIPVERVFQIVGVDTYNEDK